jgi:hypothetical protein
MRLQELRLHLMICAMKTGGRLGQSGVPQAIEEMRFFG